MENKKTLYLIDGTAYIHRAYHAIRGLTNSKGFPTNAVFGFSRMLIKLIEERTPAFAGMLFDAKGPTFRHEIYKDYKANRPPMPDEMAVQIPYIKDVSRGFCLSVIEKSGYEGDDLIGTLARKAETEGFDVIMVTGDKDFMQLVTEHVSIWDPMKEKAIDRQTIEKDFGVAPSQLIDVMSLSGDTADNVPGVPGIGPKTALSLIQQFGSLEAVYERIDDISKKKQRENLITHKDQAFLSKKLVTIDTDVPIAFRAEDFKIDEPDPAVLLKLFKELEFRQLQKGLQQKADISKKKYTAIQDVAALSELADRLASANQFALDTETTSEDPMRAALVGLSFAIQPDEAFYVPCGHDYDGVPEQIPQDTVLSRLKPVLENAEIKKIGQNIKYDWIVLKRHGIVLEGVVFDTMLASYLINPSKRAHNLDQIALDFLDHKTISYQEVAGKGKDAVNFSQVAVEKATPYACEDADVTLKAKQRLEREIVSLGLVDLFDNVEIPLVPVLMAMEMRGVCVDPDRLRDLSKSFEQQIDLLEEAIYASAGEEFNVKSSQQLGHILFEKLKLPVQKKTKKKTGYSTDVDVLTVLTEYHELPGLILRHRSLAKLKSTYADALLELIHPETGRIHTSYNQTVTATGRLSSSDPNLQNIPIRTEEGRQIRSAFIPRSGWYLLSADYSQIELRVLAHCAEDEILIQSFQKDEDIHTRTATEVFETFPEFVTPELRRQAKIINFGIIYGMGPFSLSKELGISQKMAKTYIEHYFARYKGVKRFIDQTIEEARETRKTSTLMGRIRLLPDINSSNRNVRQFAERTAVNTPIQGTAADLIKMAMINVDTEIVKRGLQTGLLLSVHDELIFEVPPDELEAVKKLVEAVMEAVCEFKVPLKVNMNWGKNWAEAH